MNLHDAAHEFATQAHAGQVRKYTGTPHIHHPEAVADWVARVTARNPAIHQKIYRIINVINYFL